MTATCKFGLIINEQTMHCSSTVSALINVQMPFHDVVSFGWKIISVFFEQEAY